MSSLFMDFGEESFSLGGREKKMVLTVGLRTSATLVFAGPEIGYWRMYNLGN